MKYYVAIMDDLLLFIPTKSSHFDKLEDLLRGTMKEWSKDIPKEVSAVQN